MTRARALKEVIRARVAKTGERYTTARRHVLKEVRPRTAALVERSPKSALPPAPAKGGVSDAKSREKTGYGLDHWFDVLDRFGAIDKGHTASARHLFDVHQVPGWYSQGITVAYERARGVRRLNQRCDGVYEVSASKVVQATAADVIKAFTDARVRRRWLKPIDADLSKSLVAALDSPASKGIIVRADGLGRYRYKWGDTTVQLYLIPKGARVSVVVTNSKLAQTAMVEERRAKWRAALEGLAQVFLTSRKRSA
jgi:hypothetical protein